ncbi:MAG: 50S ribosomal protein L6, partial [Varibaculum timonense]
MSRIGKTPISLPAGVEVKIDGLNVSVKGPKGQLERTFTGALTIREEDGKILVDRVEETRQARSLHGLTRSLISNMIEGVTNGFT